MAGQPLPKCRPQANSSVVAVTRTAAGMISCRVKFAAIASRTGRAAVSARARRAIMAADVTVVASAAGVPADSDHCQPIVS